VESQSELQWYLLKYELHFKMKDYVRDSTLMLEMNRHFREWFNALVEIDLITGRSQSSYSGERQDPTQDILLC
jgi:hypothetical protein